MEKFELFTGSIKERKWMEEYINAFFKRQPSLIIRINRELGMRSKVWTFFDSLKRKIYKIFILKRTRQNI
jgi:hypothetical protein